MSVLKMHNEQLLTSNQLLRDRSDTLVAKNDILISMVDRLSNDLTSVLAKVLVLE